MADTVFDISSDEESSSAEPELRDYDFGWLTEFLRDVDKVKGDGDDDEVVVIGEYHPPKPKSKYKSAKPPCDVGVDVDDDDDCVVLVGDPDKPVAIAEDDDGDSDGDDVLVVGQKGQIACRDYPHPRHDCAKFPFSSTPHETHCDLCHCFVCDSLAPCTHWGTGVSSSDHCHATDKHETWKFQRERLRLQKKAPLPVSDFPDTPRPLVVSQIIQIPPVDTAQVAFNPMSQNQVLTPTAIRACSTRISIPNIISQGGNNQSGYVQGRNVLQPRSGLRRTTHPNLMGRNTVPKHLGIQVHPPNTIFKKPGIVRGSLPTNRSVHGSSNNRNHAHALQRTSETASPPASAIHIPAMRQNVLPNMNSETYSYYGSSHPSMNEFIASAAVPQWEVNSEPVPQLNNGQKICPLGNQSQKVMDSGFFNIDSRWVNNYSQIDYSTSSENVQLCGGTGSINMPSTMRQCPSQLVGTSQLPHGGHEYQNCFSSQSVPLPSGGCLPNELNSFSPPEPPPPVDTGMHYFDIESSLNGLAQL